MSDLMTQDIKCHHGVVITVSKSEKIDRGRSHSMYGENQIRFIKFQDNKDLCHIYLLQFIFCPLLSAVARISLESGYLERLSSIFSPVQQV